MSAQTRGRNPLLSHLESQRQTRLNNYLNPNQAYDLQPSPTHAYLEDFDSVPSTPEPEHRPNFAAPPGGSPYGGIGLGSPRHQSPAMSSPGLDYTEKDPLDGDRFGANQYSSNHFLAPTQYPSRNASGNSGSGGRQPRQPSEKRSAKRGCLPTNPTKRKWLFIGLPIILIVIAAGAGVGVYFGMKKPTTSTGAGSSTGSTPAENFGVAGTGKTGSVVTSDLGVQFTYTSWYEGSWAQNPQNPYSVSNE